MLEIVRHGCIRRPFPTFAMAVWVVFGLATSALADEPEWEMIIDVGAPGMTVGCYEVLAEREVDFLDSVVRSGGYVGSQPGFAVEKVVRSLAGPQDGVVRYWVVTRHYDRANMSATLEIRRQVLSKMVVSPPQSVHTSVMRHRVANWGFERSEDIEFTAVAPGALVVIEPDTYTAVTSAAQSRKPAVFREYGTTLTFFKYGYTGQIARIEALPVSGVGPAEQRTLDQEGMSGVSFGQTDEGSVVSYAEFFSSPQDLARQAVASSGDCMSGFGTVVLNYRER